MLLDLLRHVTSPCYVVSMGRIEELANLVQAAFPGVDLYYAMKAQTDPRVLKLMSGRMGLEIASAGELDVVETLGLNHVAAICSHPVKRPEFIERFARFSVENGRAPRFVFDCETELEKLSRHAPGAKVLCRVRCPATRAVFASTSTKFGVTCEEAIPLLRRARALGLESGGLTNHPGSLSLDPDAYSRSLSLFLEIRAEARREGLDLDLLNLGGGLASSYRREKPPSLRAIGESISRVLLRSPSEVRVELEPGRVFVADSGVLVAAVQSVARRQGRLHATIDASTFMLPESRDGMSYSLAFDLEEKRSFEVGSLAGMSCDGSDRWPEERIPSDISVGEKMLFLGTGAYAREMAAHSFCGFPRPEVVFLEDLLPGGIGRSEEAGAEA